MVRPGMSSLTMAMIQLIEKMLQDFDSEIKSSVGKNCTYPPRRVRDLSQVLTLGLESKRGASSKHSQPRARGVQFGETRRTPSLRSHEIEDKDDEQNTAP